jgi:hypothetical protein
MNAFGVWILFALLTVSCRSIDALTNLNQPPKRCIMERVHRMIGYNCAKLELREIPKTIKTSTEVKKIST